MAGERGRLETLLHLSTGKEGGREGEREGGREGGREAYNGHTQYLRRTSKQNLYPLSVWDGSMGMRLYQYGNETEVEPT